MAVALISDFGIRPTVTLPTLFLACVSLLVQAEPIPPWFHSPAPLPPPQGAVRHASTPSELLDAVDRVQNGETILLADGQYDLTRVIVFDRKRDISIRSASGDPSRVILRGKGWTDKSRGDDILHVARCQGVTIADLTFADCSSYGVKVEAEHAPEDIHVYNCRFQNIGVRAIKGSADQNINSRAVKGSVRFCHFENTMVPPADWLFDGDYVAAIDMMALEDWTFSDNVFKNVRGRNGGGRAAIFIWVRSRQILVERNLIVDCDRGVAFGNPGRATADLIGADRFHVSNGIIRNNFIAGGPDCGIELWLSDRVQVAHNTIWRPAENWNRGIRVGNGASQVEIVNNLVHGGIILDGGEAVLRHNLTGRLDGFFLEASSGNLALTPGATGAFHQAWPMPDVTDDIRRQPRSQRPDLGAWESGRETLPLRDLR